MTLIKSKEFSKLSLNKSENCPNYKKIIDSTVKNQKSNKKNTRQITDRSMTTDFDVVLIGTDINTYYMARNFHEAYNICPHVIGRVPMLFTSLSKIIDLTIEEKLLDSNVFVNTLINMAKEINHKKIILIGCNDEYVSLIIENREVLSKYYLFNYTDLDLFSKLVNKEKFYESFKNSILDFPLTYIYDIKKKINIDKIKKFRYPIIIKPSNIIEYHVHDFEGQAKVYKLNNFHEVEETIKLIKESGYKDKLIIQEYIPGGDDLLFDSVFYVSSRGKIQLQSFGQIGLQEHTKSGIGNLTVVINGYNQFGNTKEIQQKLKKFLESIRFTGACEFDLKYDIRDKKFKVFEINPRQARSSYYLTKCGYNLATYYVDDLIYNKNNDFVFIENEVALSFVPNYIIRKYIKNKEYKKKFFELKKKGLFTHPLEYKKDMSKERRNWLFKRKINYIKKYRQNKW